MSKRKAPKADHASYAEMVSEAISQLKKRDGSSRSTIANYVKAHNDLGSVSPKVITANLRRALSTGVENGTLLISKNNGTSAYYKLADKAKATTSAKADAGASKKTTKAATKAKKNDVAVSKKAAKAETGASKKTTKAAASAKVANAPEMAMEPSPEAIWEKMLLIARHMHLLD